MKQKTAILLGATGLTGSILLDQLVNDDRYASIKLFSRKKTAHTSSKIQEFIGDILELDQFKDDFTGDVVFCCIGTTAAKTKDKALYQAIDIGIPSTAARMAKANNIPAFVVISAIGAHAKSKIFYNQTKGKMEEAVLSNQIPSTYILRPSLIIGQRRENRLGEALGSILMKVLNPFLVGKLKKYRAIKAESIATAMHLLPETKGMPTIIESDSIAHISTL